ncbi:MAG: carboxypeptidase regulatory-like domain-containing protein, partial [Isosphaeraceae bacterium]
MAALIPMICLAMGMTVPLSGTVVDADNQPVAGATVWLADTPPNQQVAKVLAGAVTDAEGRFRLDRPDDLAGRGSQRWSPTVWAYKPGSRVGFVEFMGKLPGAEEPVRIAIGPKTATTIRVLQPDGKPATATAVRPVQTKLKAPRPPDEFLQRLAMTTDAEGRATLDGLLPADILALRVTAPGQPVQSLPIDPDHALVKLRPLGRLVVRLVGDEPKALRGWTITAAVQPTEAGYQGPYTTHWLRKLTGDDGRVEIPRIAEGQILWTIKAPEGLNDLVIKQPEAMIRAGQTTEAEIVVRRGVRVEGIVREEGTGKPVAGIEVDVDRRQVGSRMVHNVVTDARGRFSKVVLPGTVEFNYDPFRLPKDYCFTPGSHGNIEFEVKEGEERHECSPPPLRKAGLVRGKVLDEAGKPVAGVDVSGTMTSGEYEQRPHTVRAETDARGEFVLGGIVPGSVVHVEASWKLAADVDPVNVPRAGEGDPIAMRLRKRPTHPLSGLVLGDDGRPMALARIHVWFRQPDQNGLDGNEFAFEGTNEVRTGPDGRYRTPDALPAGNAYRVEAEAPGHDKKRSNWVTGADLAVPALRLRRSIAFRTVDGRVVDPAGKPVAGAEVFQSGDGPNATRATTDADGRFRVPGIPDAPAFVFVAKEGYHFVGRRVEPGERSLAIAVRRLDEPAASPIRPAPAPVSREEERAIAWPLLIAARKRSGDDPQLWENRQIREAQAMVDPDRVVEMIENQIIKAEPGVVRALALSRCESEPGKALEVLDAIEKPEEAAYAALALYDRLGTSAPTAFRRELLARVARRAGEVKGLEASAKELAAGQEASLDAIRVELTRQSRRVEPASFWHDNRSQAEKRQAERRAECLRMAVKDLSAARAMAAENLGPMVEAVLPAIAARARAATDPEGARALLRESVDRLGKLGDGLLVQPSPALALALLVPMAVRIDPDRAADVLWMALSRRPSVAAIYEPHATNPTALRHYLDLIELAVLVGRFDRSAAEVVFAPVAARVSGLEDEQ